MHHISPRHRLTHDEILPRIALERVLEHVPGTRDPLESEQAWYVVCELSFGRADGARETLEETLGEGFEQGLIKDGAIAEHETQAGEFRRRRESIAGAARASQTTERGSARSRF